MSNNDKRTGIYNRKLIDALYYIFKHSNTTTRQSKHSEYRIELNNELTILFNDYYVKTPSTNSFAYIIKNWIHSNLGFDDYEKGSNKPVFITYQLGEYEFNSHFNNYLIDVEIPVSYLWIAYDIFLNHKISNMIKSYGKDLIDEAIGHPLNPMEVEQEKLRLEEIEKIKEECQAKINENYDRIEKEKKRLNDEHIKFEETIKEEMKNKIEEINAQFNELRKTIAI